jgi:hypothetical protein
MSALIAVILTRALERMLVVGAGILSIYVGYKLFALLPDRAESQGRLKLPGGFEFFATRVGPGVFFALFGAGLIGYSASRPVSYSAPELSAAAGAQGEISYVGFGSAGGAAGGQSLPAGSAARGDVVGFLNAWFKEIPADASTAVKIDRRIAATESKLVLMREIWEPAEWGDYASFHKWVTVAGQSGPPPKGNEDAAVFFNQ